MSENKPLLIGSNFKNVSDDDQATTRVQKWQTVFVVLEKILEDSSLDWPLQVFLDLGHASLQLGRFEEAGIAYGMATKRDISSVAAWRGRALAASRRGAWDEAVHLWQECLALLPKGRQPEWWWSSLGDALSKLERWEEAANIYATMRELWPQSPIGWRGGAFVASRLADWRASIEMWRACISLTSFDTQQAWWWSSIAEALLRVGHNEEAASAYEQLRLRWPHNAAGWQGGARLAILSGNWELAAAHWRTAVATLPDQALNSSDLASSIFVQIRARQLRNAAKMLQELFRRRPEEPTGLRSLSNLLLMEYGTRLSVRILNEIGLFEIPPSPSYEKDLGCRLIKPEPQSHGGEFYESQVCRGLAVIARGDVAELLELVDAAFDEIALLVLAS